MLDFSQPRTPANEVADYSIATQALLGGIRGYNWYPSAVRKYNEVWIESFAGDLVDMPNITQEALCAECGGLCLIAGVVRVHGLRIVHECHLCGKLWSVPEAYYYQSEAANVVSA